jgi:hypothetical protein
VTFSKMILIPHSCISQVKFSMVDRPGSSIPDKHACPADLRLVGKLRHLGQA